MTQRDPNLASAELAHHREVLTLLRASRDAALAARIREKRRIARRMRGEDDR